MKTSLKPKYFPLAVIAALLTACSQSEENVLTSSNGVCFTASIGQSPTRATEESFEANDAISVFAFKNETGFSGEEYAHNRKYSFQNQQFTADEQNMIKQPTDGSQLSYVAVYPYSEAADAKFTFQVKEDQATGSNYTQSDLMMASTYLTDNQSPTLMFSHCLSSIVVNLSFAKAPAGNVSVKITNALTTAAVNLATATFAGNGEISKSVIAAYNGTNSYKAILPPQTTSAGNTGIEIIVGDATPLSYKFPETIKWKSGIRYNYTLYIKEDGTISDVAPEETIKKRAKQMIWEDWTTGELIYGTSYNFKYDNQGRLVDCSGPHHGPITGYDSIKISYTANTIIVEDKYYNVEAGIPATDTQRYTYTLNDKGQVTKIYDSDLDSELTLSYTNEYLTKLVNTKNGNQYSFEWTDGKMTKMWMNEGHFSTLNYTSTANYKLPFSVCEMVAGFFSETTLGGMLPVPNTYFGNGMEYLPATMDCIWWGERPFTVTYTCETDADGYVTKLVEDEGGGNYTTYTVTYEDIE